MTYTQAIAKCKDIFSEKFTQYGDSFVAFTKEQLLQKIEAKIEAAHSLLQGDEACRDSFTSIYNYAVIAYMLETPSIETGSWEGDYSYCQDVFEAVYLAKDKQYHSKWKTMSISHLLSEIAVKIRRNQSGGIDITAFRDNLIDIANYAAFAEIRYENNARPIYNQPTLTSICKTIREKGKRETLGENMSVHVITDSFENENEFNFIFLVNHFQNSHIYVVQEQMSEGEYLLEVISNECPRKSYTPNTNEFNDISCWLVQITNIL